MLFLLRSMSSLLLLPTLQLKKIIRISTSTAECATPEENFAAEFLLQTRMQKGSLWTGIHTEYHTDKLSCYNYQFLTIIFFISKLSDGDPSTMTQYLKIFITVFSRKLQERCTVTEKNVSRSVMRHSNYQGKWLVVLCSPPTSPNWC